MNSRALTSSGMQGARRLRRAFVLLLIGLQALLVIAVVAGAFQYARLLRDNALKEQSNHAERNVQGAEEHLSQTLYLIERTLTNLPELSGFRPGQAATETQSRLETLQRQMPVLRSLSLADQTGRIVASSAAANLGRQVALHAMLPDVPVERTGLLRLGAPWQGRDFADGHPTHPDRAADPLDNTFIPLALALPGKDGLVAVAAANSDYFLNRILGSFDATLLSVTVFDYNGTLLLGNTADLSPGSRSAEPDVLEHVKREEIGRLHDTLHAGSPVTTVFRASRNYPLYVVGHASHERVLALWREEIRGLSVVAGLTLLGTLLITGLLTQRLLATLARENRLQEDQRRAALVFDNSNDGIIITAADTSILSVNPAFERISGYCAAEVIGRSPRLLSSGQHDQAFYARLWQTLNQEGEWRGEMINRRKDGSTLTEWLTITRMLDDQGEVRGYLGFFHDLSELRRSEQLVRRLSAAVEQSPSSIIITNLESVIEYVNPQFTRATGYAPEEALGRNPRFLQSRLTPPETFRSLWERLTAGAAWEGEFINRRKDGTVFYDHATLAPIRDGSGKTVQYLAIQHDITARKIAENALVDAKLAAEAANRAKTAFLANMSHELRTPMHGVMGMLALAKRRMSDAKGLDQLDKAKLSAERLLIVLNDILDISKIEADRMVLEEAPLQLGAVLEQLDHLIAPRAAEKGLAWRIDIPPELAQAPLLGDSLRLGQILTNLAGNAIKFTDRGEVSVAVSLEASSPETLALRFECHDSGIGITPEALQRVFSAFEQADNSMTRRFGGTGLGLAICKRLAEMMGGAIGVDSVPGSGSHFWFSVRLRRRDVDAVTPAPTI